MEDAQTDITPAPSRSRTWWLPNPSGWRRLDGWRIDTPHPDAMETGPWFGLAFPPDFPTGYDGYLPDFIKGLNAAEAMDKIDAAFPMGES